MANFNEMPAKIQALFVAGVVLGLSIAAYFFIYKGRVDANQAAQQALVARKAENDALRPYEPKLQELTRQIALLKDQLEIQKRIVPDEKEADQFMRLMQETATTAGIEIRRYTSKATAQAISLIVAFASVSVDATPADSFAMTAAVIAETSPIGAAWAPCAEKAATSTTDGTTTPRRAKMVLSRSSARDNRFFAVSSRMPSARAVSLWLLFPKKRIITTSRSLLESRSIASLRCGDISSQAESASHVSIIGCMFIALCS